jgi:hypothetical protein
MEIERAGKQRRSVEQLRSLGAACFFDYQMSTANSHPPRLPNRLSQSSWSERIFGQHMFAQVASVEFYPWEVDDEERDRLVGMGNMRTFRWVQGLPKVRERERQPKVKEWEPLLPQLIKPKPVTLATEPNPLRFGDNEMHLLTDLSSLESLNLGYTYITGAGLSQLTALPRLTELLLQATDVGDEGMKHLGKLTQLRVLHLNYTQVTDAGLVHLRQLSNLETLLLDGTDIGDAGVAHLSCLKRLRVLSLSETNVTCNGIAHLESISTLEQVLLHRTHVTGSGMSSLQKAFPNCLVQR